MEAAGKMGVLDRLLDRLKGRGHRVVLFSQFNKMLDIIEDFLIMRGYRSSFAMDHNALSCTCTSAVALALQLNWPCVPFGQQDQLLLQPATGNIGVLVQQPRASSSTCME